MTAKRSFPLSAPLAALTMIGAFATLSACAGPPAPPPPAPIAQPAPTPPPENWMDAPRTAGDWSYQRDGSGTVAAYRAPGDAPLFMVRCDAGRRQIALARALPRQGVEELPMRILTETGERIMGTRPIAAPTPMSASVVAASDPLLDAMAFSKGRFAVEVAGLDTLYLPSWVELSRVIEDCR